MSASDVALILERLERIEERVESLSARLPSRLLTVEEAARELGVCADTVRRKCRDGELAHRRVGRVIRIDIDASRPLVQR